MSVYYSPERQKKSVPDDRQLLASVLGIVYVSVSVSASACVRVYVCVRICANVNV